ncbi:MAG: hypothetical protein J5970_05000 [Bacilli bacterium]|nr:hypothetical protein [Bacilli bacterium]
MRKINGKRALATALAAGMLFTAGCGKTDKVNKDVSTQTDAITTEATEEVVTATESEAVEVTNDTFIDGDLDIYNDSSIEHEAEENYNDFKEFYDNHGIDKDQIEDMIYVLNDKYTDESGNAIIDNARAEDAYANIDTVMGADVDDEIIQKIDNINTINYQYAEDDSEEFIEQQESISEEVDDANSNWTIEEYPTFDNLVDTDIAGGAKTAEKLSEYVEMRNTVIDGLNKDVIEKDTIAEYIKKQEVTDYNANQDGMNAIKGNGQKYAIASSKNAALQMAAPAFYTETYLPGYDAIDQNIKINPTNEEIFLENTIIDMIEAGTLDKDAANAVIDEIGNNTITDETGALTYTGEEDTLIEKYGLTNDQFRMLMSYSFYRTTMAYVKDKEVMCEEKNETHNEIDKLLNNKESKNDLTNKNVKKLILVPTVEQA